jgi:hypothetical protein
MSDAFHKDDGQSYADITDFVHGQEGRRSTNNPENVAITSSHLGTTGGTQVMGSTTQYEDTLLLLATTFDEEQPYIVSSAEPGDIVDEVHLSKQGSRRPKSHTDLSVVSVASRTTVNDASQVDNNEHSEDTHPSEAVGLHPLHGNLAVKHGHGLRRSAQELQAKLHVARVKSAFPVSHNESV